MSLSNCTRMMGKTEEMEDGEAINKEMGIERCSGFRRHEDESAIQHVLKVLLRVQRSRNLSVLFASRKKDRRKEVDQHVPWLPVSDRNQFRGAV